jgi:CBS domain-containing protein
MRVGDVAARPPVAVSPDTTIEQAARAMAADGVGCLVVTEGGTVVGIVTDRDLVVRGLADRVPPDGRIDAVMTTHVVAVDVDSDVRDVIRTFGHHAVRRLPLVSGRHLVGIVTVDDLLVAMTDEIGLLTRGITAQLLFPHAGDEPQRPVPVG